MNAVVIDCNALCLRLCLRLKRLKHYKFRVSGWGRTCLDFHDSANKIQIQAQSGLFCSLVSI